MPPQKEITVWIGGAAGDGIASAGDVWVKTLARMGLGAFAHNSYQSVIRGGHVLLQCKAGPYPVLSQGGKWDFLVALDQRTIDLNWQSAQFSSGVLYNSDALQVPTSEKTSSFGLPIKELSADLPKNPVIQNTVLLGALTFLAGLPWEVFEGALRDQFGKRKPALADLNATVGRRGWDYAQKNFKPAAHIALTGDSRKRMVLTGNQAIAMGAIAGGCKLYAAYPMTPASSILHYLASRAPKYGMLMKQTEDEIAAMNMAIGAGYAGVRAMVGTSGGGFALMTEAVGMAGMIEAPVVVVLAQRGGPSTGLPTKTEQGDLFQALGASQGEYPRAILAPLDVTDAFFSTIEALNLAEKYQMPVILMTDMYLSERNVVLSADSLQFQVPIERGEILAAVEGEYLRYRDTASGVSPRVLPGTPDGMHMTTSDEHDEAGHLISDVFSNPSTRTRMMEKRMRKLGEACRDMEDRGILVEGTEDAELTVVGWGSTYQILEEARRNLQDDGHSVRLVQCRQIWPFPARKMESLLNGAPRTVCVENNHGGLFARLLRQETGISIPFAIHKFDGEPFSAEPLTDALRACLGPKPPALQTLISSEMDIPVSLK
jgi:2-oxoglutarate ferredoxin oxidoreductase subunit alpha